jgi:bacteriorhodopsin
MPALMNQLLDPQTREPRSAWFWILFGSLVVAQLFAFWLLCSHQVRKAEARRTDVVVQQMALSDCLQYIPGSTIASCSSRIGMPAAGANGTMAAGDMPVPVETSRTMSGATPVSYIR